MKYVYYIVYMAKNSNNETITGTTESTCGFMIKSMSDIINIKKSLEIDTKLHNVVIVNFILLNTL